MKIAHAWKQSGRISMWRYTEHARHFPGWHFTADEPGCLSMLALIDALNLDGSGGRTVALMAPTLAQLRVPANKAGQAPWQGAERLRLMLSSDLKAWSLTLSGTLLLMEAGSDWMPALREGIAGTRMGRGDYSIGDRKCGDPLWFWW